MLTWAQDQWARLPAIIKLVGSISGSAGLVAGAIISTPPAWAIVEPWVYASRGWVREYHAHQIAEGTRDLRIAQAETARAMQNLQRNLQIDSNDHQCANVASQIITLSAELSKEADEIARQRKSFQIVQRKNEYDSLDTKLRDLRGSGCPYSTGQ